MEMMSESMVDCVAMKVKEVEVKAVITLRAVDSADGSSCTPMFMVTSKISTGLII